MTDDFDIERTLRASLADNARRAPSGEALAEYIIAESDRPLRVHNGARPHRWRLWSLPLIAAGSVAAVVGVVLGAGQLDRTSAHPAVSHLNTPVPPPVLSTHAPAPPSRPVPVSSPMQVPPSTEPAPPPGIGPVPQAFRATDLTFTGTDHGWALGTGQCFSDPRQRCSALLRTTDGGASWESVLNPPAHVASGSGCAAPCVVHLRFANDRVGYAFGPDALFMTTDGAQTWDRQSGGASSLEVANGTAVRVTDGSLLVSAVGSTFWKPAPMQDGSAVDEMARAGQWAFVRAGGAMYTSADGGVTWMYRGDPCGSAAPAKRMALLRLVAAADGSVITLCAGPTGDVLLTSSDGGETFGKPAPATFAHPAPLLAAADRATLFSAGKGLNRSTDGGLTWQRVPADPTSGATEFLGFETPTTGRWLTGDGSTIWTTTNGGRTWSERTFG